MKLTLTNTGTITEVKTEGGGCAVPARVWEGYTESGIHVRCYITRIEVPAEAEQEKFQRELQECRPPVLDVIPIRMPRARALFSTKNSGIFTGANPMYYFNRHGRIRALKARPWRVPTSPAS